MADEKTTEPTANLPQNAPLSTAENPTVPAAPGAAPTEDKPRKKKKPGKAPRRGRKSRNMLKSQDQKVRASAALPPKAAVQMLKSLKRAKFDETVEIHLNLGIDAAQSDQTVRGSVSLPNGIGKAVRVAVFCQGDNVAKAKAAGADFVGGSDLVEKVQKENFLDFDVAIATQDMMGQVSRLGKVLGRAPSCRLRRRARWCRRGKTSAAWCASSRRARSSTAPIKRASCTRASAS